MIPRRTLPPSALVIALSPLLDPRSVGALLDLRARGFDLAVDRHLAGAVHGAAGAAASTPSPMTLAAAARRAAPSLAARRRRRRRVGRDASRCRPFSRRCGHSGATPGTRASDHRRSARSRALGGAGAYAATARARSPASRPAAGARARAARRSASSCAGRRRSRGRSCSTRRVLRRDTRDGKSVVDGWASRRRRAAARSRPSSPPWSIEHDARIRPSSPLIVRRGRSTLAALAAAALLRRLRRCSRPRDLALGRRADRCRRRRGGGRGGRRAARLVRS